MPLMTPGKDVFHKGKLFKGGVEQSIPDDLAAILGYKAPSTVQSIVLEGAWTSNQAVDFPWTPPAGKRYLGHRAVSQSSVGAQPWINQGYMYWNSSSSNAVPSYENYFGTMYTASSNKFAVWRSPVSNYSAGCKIILIIDVIDI